MANYNFTIRATDSLGAFADRDFSIQIKNTIIERMIAVGSTDLATTHNGTDWTIRAGKGGNFGECMLDRWVVFSSVDTYRFSPDTINWIEDNKLIVKVDGEDIKMSIFVYSANLCFTEASGRLIMVVHDDDNKMHLIESSDLISWKLCEFSNQPQGTRLHNFVENFLPSAWVLYGLSNIIEYDGDVLMFDGGKFIRYNPRNGELTTSVLTVRNAKPENTSRYLHLINRVNGRVIMCSLNGAGNTSSSAPNIPVVIQHTSDLKNTNMIVNESHAVLSPTTGAYGAADPTHSRKNGAYYDNGRTIFSFASLMVWVENLKEVNSVTAGSGITLPNCNFVRLGKYVYSGYGATGITRAYVIGANSTATGQQLGFDVSTASVISDTRNNTILPNIGSRTPYLATMKSKK